MDGLGYLIGIALSALVALGTALVVRRHRQRLQAMERRLAWSEQSRFDAELHAEAMGAQMADLQLLLRQRRPAAPLQPHGDAPAAGPHADADADAGAGAGDQAERDLTLGQALARMPHGPHGPHGPHRPPGADDLAWIDTEPMVGSYVVPAYAPTRPADLEPGLPPRATPQTGQPA
ncbi:MAG TPA: hypothetical protein PLT38_02325 [Rubrivivax sp.]|nr:hypothetical protein [Rubrivivax sp.]